MQKKAASNDDGCAGEVVKLQTKTAQQHQKQKREKKKRKMPNGIWQS